MNNLLFLFFLEQSKSTASERHLLIYMICVLIIICSLTILFFIVFQKRKNKILVDKFKQQQAFEEEISRTQVEIQEQTLKNIGQELHDNVGQILSVANMNMSILSTQVTGDIKESFLETKNTVKQGLSELRSLSKSLNSDVIINRGFQKSIENEMQRLNKLGLLSAELIIEGDSNNFTDSKDGIILFRIIQEFISNTVKYAKASSIKITLNYLPKSLNILATDNGDGFDIASAEKGSGLINMKSRAELINTSFDLKSSINSGTILELVYPYKTED